MGESKGNVSTLEQGRQPYHQGAGRQATHAITRSPQGMWDVQRRDAFGNLVQRMTEDRVFDRVRAPRIEAFQNDSRFVVRAELPGLKKEDVNVNVTDQTIILDGQRKTEQEEDREGFHTKRSYGSFHRAIPLPEGTITDSAEARFKDGVLVVTLQAPPSDVRQGRRVEIK